MRRAAFVLMVAVSAMIVGTANIMAVQKGDAKTGAKKSSSSYVTGILAVTRNDKSVVEAATITTKSFTVYNIDMAGFSQDCSDQDGKEVKAYGEVKEVDGKMVLKVNGKIMKVGGDKPGKKEKASAASMKK